MEKRTTPGEYVKTGTQHDAYHCDACNKTATVATWKAPDGTEGLFCAFCAKDGKKSAVRDVKVDDVKWVRGKVEVKCCGRWINCANFTNTCGCCGTDYNGVGQRLAPREQWGEETGETPSDILDL